MISLTCTHCQTVLSIDDAFAGGVCRCQHCGTIQTVPSRLKNGAAIGTEVGQEQPVAPGQKALFQTRRPASVGRSDETTGSGTGLEDLADVVASSGLGGSGLSSSVKPRKPQRRASIDSAVATPKKRPPVTVLVAAGAALAAVIAIAVWWFLPSSNKQTPNADPGVTSNGEPAPVAGPQFCGMPISGSSVVFLLDRGDSARESFDGMKEATYKAIESLGSERKFQVLLWDNNSGDAGYPNASTTYATPENLDACRKALEDITPQHQSTIGAPLTRAVGESPDSIVIVTAKGFELDDSFTADVQGIVKANPIKLFTVSLQGRDQADCHPLQVLAKQSGGAYKSLSNEALRAAAGQ